MSTMKVLVVNFHASMNARHEVKVIWFRKITINLTEKLILKDLQMIKFAHTMRFVLPHQTLIIKNSFYCGSWCTRYEKMEEYKKSVKVEHAIRNKNLFVWRY